MLCSAAGTHLAGGNDFLDRLTLGRVDADSADSPSLVPSSYWTTVPGYERWRQVRVGICLFGLRSNRFSDKADNPVSLADCKPLLSCFPSQGPVITARVGDFVKNILSPSHLEFRLSSMCPSPQHSCTHLQ